MSAPVVGILMGSISDYEVMAAGFRVLRDLGVPFEARVLSAHRSPAAVAEYAASADSRGLRVLIAGAGGAAHLAGTVAAHTRLPVIGVPLVASSLAGLDALLATVQMPGGVPVATVGVGKSGATNAAHLAARMLAVGDPDVATRVDHDREQQTLRVETMQEQLQARMRDDGLL